MELKIRNNFCEWCKKQVYAPYKVYTWPLPFTYFCSEKCFNEYEVERRIGTHKTHCCIFHGCKYSDPDCPVYTRRVKASYSCYQCGEEGLSMQEAEDLVLNVMDVLNNPNSTEEEKEIAKHKFDEYRTKADAAFNRYMEPYQNYKNEKED